METTFPHAYECERLIETPNTASPHYYFPGASTKGGQDGILVGVRPERGQAWLGTFAFGQVTPKGVTGVYTTPDPRRVCVVSRGEGYLVNATAPTEWEAIRATPIIDVRSILARLLIVFADYTTLFAYGQTGIVWKTKRLTWDSMEITEVTDAFIKGEFWDIRREATANFTVDLATGLHQGGIGEG